MKFAEGRPYAEPEAAARKLIEIANSVEAVQDGRIYIEKINGPFLFEFKGTLAEYGAGLKLAIERGWLPAQSYLRKPRQAERPHMLKTGLWGRRPAPVRAAHLCQRKKTDGPPRLKRPVPLNQRLGQCQP
jgi:hypothetical protein